MWNEGLRTRLLLYLPLTARIKEKWGSWQRYWLKNTLKSEHAHSANIMNTGFGYEMEVN